MSFTLSWYTSTTEKTGCRCYVHNVGRLVHSRNLIVRVTFRPRAGSLSLKVRKAVRNPTTTDFDFRSLDPLVFGSGKFLNGWRGLVRSPLPGPLPPGEGRGEGVKEKSMLAI